MAPSPGLVAVRLDRGVTVLTLLCQLMGGATQVGVYSCTRKRRRQAGARSREAEEEGHQAVLGRVEHSGAAHGAGALRVQSQQQHVRGMQGQGFDSGLRLRRCTLALQQQSRQCETTSVWWNSCREFRPYKLLDFNS